MMFRDLLGLAVTSVMDPRAGIRTVLSWQLPRDIGWLALATVSALSSLVTLGPFYLRGIDNLPVWISNPLIFFGLQLFVSVIAVHLVDSVGRRFGGTGDFDGAIMVMVWHGFVMLCYSVVQLLADLLAPPLAQFMRLIGLGIVFWLLSGFVAQHHGFVSIANTFLGILVTIIVVAFLSGFILVALGVPSVIRA